MPEKYSTAMCLSNMADFSGNTLPGSCWEEIHQNTHLSTKISVGSLALEYKVQRDRAETKRLMFRRYYPEFPITHSGSGPDKTRT